VRFLGWLGFFWRVFQVVEVPYPGPAVSQYPGPVVVVILVILDRVGAYPVPGLESWPPLGSEDFVRLVQ
jgi:hypothetical protein